MKKRTASLLATTLFSVSAMSAEKLNITHYNPGSEAIFPASSVLVSGDKEAILFDAQFSTTDGQKLVELVKESGKTLSMIYISAGDPDYYFGLEPIVAAFPNVEVVASRTVVDHINKTKEAKLEYWGPILGEHSPSKVIVPSVLDKTSLTLDGKTIEVKEINSHQAYLWVPSEKTVFGGISVYSGVHVWMADTQKKKAREQWVQSLERMKKLEPQVVIPGHYLGEMPKGIDGVQFTIDYLGHIESVLEDKHNLTSKEIIKTMKDKYPELQATESDLTLGAQVLSGEVEWH
ncbi:MBL fold metallo-hydrolase [Vibrio pectenicida]|uniref:MBL fold metallo-hydrolase n=1 Tax=Vibrio pectenicida TaxID=62763 RepID=A0A7Y3ZWR1_9VIBR|nr:Vmh family MBL fold metallo-hydrolase [Vibrio pectenicida]NOH70510.1 MBL fold metallo-hydrolase [Vibrio pectenicida]